MKLYIKFSKIIYSVALLSCHVGSFKLEFSLYILMSGIYTDFSKYAACIKLYRSSRQTSYEFTTTIRS